jgi:hypothetical protein
LLRSFSMEMSRKPNWSLLAAITRR